jgi:hypothetical protein
VQAQENTTSEAQLQFTTPAGRRIAAEIFPQFLPEAVVTAAEDLRRNAPGVNANTCTPKWQGEPCDYGMAIEAMLKHEATAGSGLNVTSLTVASEECDTPTIVPSEFSESRAGSSF